MRFLFGFISGIINGALGTGGGMVCVPLLEHMGLDEKEAHATSISIILPITTVSMTVYYLSGYLDISSVFPFLPFGAIGAVFGSLMLPKIKGKLLRRIFGVMMIVTAISVLLYKIARARYSSPTLCCKQVSSPQAGSATSVKFSGRSMGRWSL